VSKIKLWEYVLENDKEADFIKWRSGENSSGDKLNMKNKLK